MSRNLTMLSILPKSETSVLASRRRLRIFWDKGRISGRAKSSRSYGESFFEEFIRKLTNQAQARGYFGRREVDHIHCSSDLLHTTSCIIMHYVIEI